MSGPIDLDHNATTRPSAAVLAAMAHAAGEAWHNPSSVHRGGQRARALVELAREQTAGLLGGVDPRRLVFTSGGTESISAALWGALEAMRRRGVERRVLITSPSEHAAVRDAAAALGAQGLAATRWLALGPGGRVDLGDLERALNEGGSGKIVSVQWANNETGVVQDVAAIADLCRRASALFHCDATQRAGKEPVTAQDMELFDLLSCAPHKYHGPKGVGVLYAAAGVACVPLTGGAQELGRRGGTENVPGIAGAGVAAQEAVAWLADARARAGQAQLRGALEEKILAACPQAVVNARGAPRLWNTSNIGFPGLSAEALVLMLSERGVYVSAGAACSSGSLEPSPVLLAVGVPEHLAHGSIRLSLSKHTTGDEIDRAAGEIARAAGSLRGRA